MSTSKRLIKAFNDAIPLGPHDNPHSEFITVRLDFIQEAIDHLDWLEKGVSEWRSESIKNAQVRATARIAIKHLVTVLEGCRTAGEQQNADSEAREWLCSIGSI